MTVDKTLASSSFAGRREQKKQFTLLLYCNTTGTKKRPLMFTRMVETPRWFKMKSGSNRDLYWWHNRRASMTVSLFKEWLLYVDADEGKTVNCIKLLIMDNSSPHGTMEMLPNLSTIEVILLSPSPSGCLQSRDAGIIAAMNGRYSKGQMEHAVGLMQGMRTTSTKYTS